MSFAKVTIVGRLGQDPESRYLQSGALVVSFSMAADGRKRSGAEQPSTTWFRVSAFGEQAERLVNMIERGYIAKGRQLYVEGQLEARPYTGQDGQSRTSLDVNLTDWRFIGSAQQDQQRAGGASGGRSDYSGSGVNESYSGGSSFGGSDYGDKYPSGDDSGGDINDVPF